MRTGTREVLWLPQLGSTHDEAVMVYAGTSSSGTLSYTYGASEAHVGAPEFAGEIDGIMVDVLGSGSARPAIRLSVPEAAAGRSARLEIHDVTGGS